MNLFILDTDPVQAARLQCDKHVVKMIVESGQMLSTAHRMLDGELTARPSKSGKTTVKYWKLPDDREDVLYKAVHMGHPCTVWTMESSQNYNWHLIHFAALLDEYSYRYDKVHATDSLKPYLVNMPKNIKIGKITPFKLAMGSNPECINEADPVGSYRKFYQTKKDRFKMAWTKRDIPEWFDPMTKAEKRALYPY
jgi:hypothetical protein